MCGILGLVTSNKISKKNFKDSLKLISHRGPDNFDTYFKTLKDKKIALGHVRLSIIDLSKNSNQPFSIGDYNIVFNGEIYNFESIKIKLEKKGVVFKTRSDTETILQSYIRFGIKKTLKLLHGMFAFVILDKKKNKMILARDRIGIKPLYYLISNNQFIFSSETKSIKKLFKYKLDINLEAAANFYYHKYIYDPKTIFKKINAVEAGEFLELNIKNLKISKNRYWNLKRNIVEKNETEVIDKVEELLHQSIKKHLVSDVPISFAFSGGLDSSLLIAIARQYTKNIIGFTIKRSEKDIDYIYSKKIGEYLNIKHEVTDFKDLKINGVDKRLYRIYDQPIGCSSIFSTYLLYKKISKKFKVCISGDGGDEVFGGYKWYQQFLDTKQSPLKISKNPTRIKAYIKHKYFFPNNDIEKYKKIMLNRFSKNEVENIFNSKIKEDEFCMYRKYIKTISSIKDMMYVDFFTFLKYILIRLDLSSMAHSVENRVPYLDHKLVEYAYSIDPNLHYKNGELKYILKKVAEKYLPKEYIYRDKRGFSAPINNLLKLKNAKENMRYIYKQWEYYHFK